MEDKFIHDEFEEFLQDQVRNHRMYPADAVWREIDRKLHGEKRWPALTIAAAMLVGATVLICVYFTPKTNIFTIPVASVNTATSSSSDKSNILNNLTSSMPFAEPKRSGSAISQNNFTGPVSSLTTANAPVDAQLDNVKVDKEVVESSSSAAANTQVALSSIGPITTAKHLNSHSLKQNEGSKPSPQNEMTVEDKSIPLKQEIDKKASNLNALLVDDKRNRNLNSTSKNYYSDFSASSRSRRSASRGKFSYQLYIAPSISYRKLLEDNSLIKENSGGPVGISYVTDVNKVVRHKPGTGMEVGLSFMYSLSRKVRLKSGFQFNMRQYSIEAYRSSTELASIALVGNNRLDTINTLAIYRTNNGYYSTKLVNRYYQLSAPIGVEWEVLGNKVIQLNVAGTIQPTYLLNRNAYLLSTNFKNYTESPGVIRQWNINSNVEAFISIKAGDYKWQLGPQLRYQPYSTFIPEYSIKEHLMDYGFKLGLSKTIR